MMERLELLKQISFGAQVAEDEIQDLANYFVETDQWDRIFRGRIDIVRGEKGAGKSAIYSLLSTKSDELFDRGILLVAAERPRGDTVFKDIIADPPASEREFEALWKIYILALIAHKLREYDITGTDAQKLYRILEEAKLLEREFDLRGLLRVAQHYVRRLINAESIEAGLQFDPNTGIPTGIVGKITMREPILNLKDQGYISIDNLLQSANKALSAHNYKVWVMLDRLDVAFAESHDLEANALRALFKVYSDMRAFDRISLKIFLREDIWKRIFQPGFREASHLTDYAILEWPPNALLNLIVRRLLNNAVLLKEFGIDKNAVLRNSDAQEALFKRLFPLQVEQGPQKSPTFKWMLSRCADATGNTAPREVIHLLKSVQEREIQRLERGGVPPSDDQLFDRSVFKSALIPVSTARLHQYLYAEYPEHRKFIALLENTKTEQTADSLAKIWSVTEQHALREAESLREIGFFERRGSREEPTYWVPFLYRGSLNMIQGRAEEEDD